MSDALLSITGLAVSFRTEDGPGLSLRVNDETAPAGSVVQIKIDVTGLDVGDSIHISHVKLPQGSSSAITDRDFTIATIVAPSGLRSEEGDNSKTEGAAEE